MNEHKDKHPQAARLIFDQGRGDRDLAMSELCDSFHVLINTAGVRPWDVTKFAGAQRHASSQRMAALFVLNVWNDNGDWPAFDFHTAWGLWDDRNRQAFLDWANAPWWP